MKNVLLVFCFLASNWALAQSSSDFTSRKQAIIEKQSFKVGEFTPGGGFVTAKCPAYVIRLRDLAQNDSMFYIGLDFVKSVKVTTAVIEEDEIETVLRFMAYARDNYLAKEIPMNDVECIIRCKSGFTLCVFSSKNVLIKGWNISVKPDTISDSFFFETKEFLQMMRLLEDAQKAMKKMRG